MRGGTLLWLKLHQLLKGLSPHARGNRAAAKVAKLDDGPIPACAGEPCALYVWTNDLRAYPRMRGGTDTICTIWPRLMGLSPHARGNRGHRTQRGQTQGPIPACAGEPRVGIASETR
jgi:hypothetical protein